MIHLYLTCDLCRASLKGLPTEWPIHLVTRSFGMGWTYEWPDEPNKLTRHYCPGCSAILDAQRKQIAEDCLKATP